MARGSTDVPSRRASSVTSKSVASKAGSAAGKTRSAAGKAAHTASGGLSGSNPAVDRLKGEVQNLVGAVGERTVSSLRDRVSGAADRLTDYVENGAGPGLMAAVRGTRDLAEGKSPAKSALDAGATGLKEKIGGLFGRGGKGGRKGAQPKATNIIESIDVGVPVSVAYDQWTRFTDFPGFMKKVENVEQASDETLRWRAKIFWSRREWESTIVSQVPDDKIVWRSKGAKGHVDGAITFHELAPNLTRIVMVLEYHPQGLFERTGNLWRAQGRRARLELKHFQRHVMTQTILKPEEIEGWRGVIEDAQVVQQPGERDQDEEEEPRERDRVEEAEEEETAEKPEPRKRPRAGAGGRRTRSSLASEDDLENENDLENEDDSGRRSRSSGTSRSGRSTRTRSGR
jgi:hypothetical protein